MIKKKGKARFVLAKSPRDTADGLVKLNYKRNFEKSLAISLFTFVLLFRLSTNINIEKYQSDERVIFEFIDILEPPPLVEELPKLEMEDIVILEIKEEPVDEDLMQEIEELLGENSDEVELSLASNDVGLLLADSQMGSVGRAELNFRTHRRDNSALALGDSRYGSSAIEGGLDIGESKRNSRKLVSNDAKLNLDFGKTIIPQEKNERDADSEPKLGIGRNSERIISFGASTIGTEDYKIWNKISSELDRLNKGRYGKVPGAIKRHRGGFTVTFGFSNNVKHEIHWKNNGKVWIKVIGSSEKSNLQELRRTLAGLLQLSFEN